MKDFLSKKAKSITPYVAGQQPSGENIIKLNTNESPYAPSKRVYDAVKSITGKNLRKYPHPNGGDFRESAAKYVNMPIENVFCGNGSDEVLAFAFQAFFDKEKKLSMPDITYSFYPVWADLYDIPIKRIPLNDDLTINIEDYFFCSGGVIIANPNAQTGIALKKEKVELIVKNNPENVVIIDEAYIEFSGELVCGLVKKFDNLLVVRTLSKSQCLAGIRAGFAIGSKSLIDGLFRIKDSFNSYPVNSLTSAAAAAALDDKAYYDKISKKVIETREWTQKKLEELGFYVPKSSANFVFVKPKGISAKEIFEKLRAKGIFVRWFDKDKVRDFLRISIGTDEEMKKLISCLEIIINKEK